MSKAIWTPALATGVTVLTLVGVTPRAAETPVPTFARDVAPIVFNKCTSCHRPGEAAPFALQSYADVKRRGALIATAVQSRVMPPWKAAPGDFAFRGDRTLTEQEVDTISRWVKGGMPEGDVRQVPPVPAFTTGWQLGPPDLVVSMPEGFDVPAYGPDVYRNFVLPLQLTEDRWVKAVDFRPSARSVVHHSLFFLDMTGTARQQDARDAAPGFDGAMGGFGGGGRLRALLAGGRGAGAGGRAARAGNGGGGVGPADIDEQLRAANGLGGWALGAQPRPLPDGLAFFVPKGADLVLSTHFHPSGKAEKEASVVGIYFADGPPRQAFAGVQLPPVFGALAGIDIPAGDKEYTVHDSWVLPVDVKAFNAGAHAHYLAKHMTLTATLPGGDRKTLLEIKNWDFAWQEQYQYRDMVALPKGTRLDSTITYDNSADNPRNPSHPPAPVRWGEQSTDEMGSMGIQVVTDRPDDLRTLQLAYAQHLRDALLNGPGLGLLLRGRGGR